jgi:hypothetical protein
VEAKETCRASATDFRNDFGTLIQSLLGSIWPETTVEKTEE